MWMLQAGEQQQPRLGMGICEVSYRQARLKWATVKGRTTQFIRCETPEVRALNWTYTLEFYSLGRGNHLKRSSPLSGIRGKTSDRVLSPTVTSFRCLLPGVSGREQELLRQNPLDNLPWPLIIATFFMMLRNYLNLAEAQFPHVRNGLLSHQVVVRLKHVKCPCCGNITRLQT